MEENQDFLQIVHTCVARIKEAVLDPSMKPEELRLVFNKALITKNDYWEINKDSNKLTKLGLIFKPSKANIQKGKPIYVALLFDASQLKILLEEQYARNDNNTFEISYDLMFTNWKKFEDKLRLAFIIANNLANGIKQRC